MTPVNLGPTRGETPSTQSVNANCMKFLPLIWCGIWRKPVRTILVLLQVSVAFALFGVLQGMKTGVEEAIARIRADLLMVFPNAFGEPALPVAYKDRLLSIPGVKTVVYADGFLGSYQKPDQAVYVLGIEKSDIWLTLIPEIFKILPADLQALQKTRSGVLISAAIAKTYGWKIGDHIPLSSSTLQRNGSGNWVFEVVGMFTPHEVNGGGFIVTNYEYLDEARVANKGTVRNFYVVAADPHQVAVVAEAIDRTFTNAPSETSTASLRENAQQSMQQIGDLNFVTRSIVSAVFAALLFSIATMMMQSIRERTPELGVLKVVGFTNHTIFVLVVAETVVVCVAGALIGLALSAVAFPYTAKWIPGLTMPLGVVEVGVVAACLVALTSATLPAARAARLRVVDALADT
jgi:putative ABC transport system permease protein